MPSHQLQEEPLLLQPGAPPFQFLGSSPPALGPLPNPGMTAGEPLLLAYGLQPDPGPTAGDPPLLTYGPQQDSHQRPGGEPPSPPPESDGEVMNYTQDPPQPDVVFNEFQIVGEHYRGLEAQITHLSGLMGESSQGYTQRCALVQQIQREGQYPLLNRQI